MGSEYSLKELYDVLLKPTYDIEVNGKTFGPTEVVIALDKVQIGNFKEITKDITAHGGAGDKDRVWWETVKEVQLNMTQGVFSNEQLAILTNARLVTKGKDVDVLLTQRECQDANDSGQITLKYAPVDYLNVYDENGNKATYTQIPPKTIGGLQVGKQYTIDYGYLYNNGYSTITIGSQLTNGYFSLQAKTRVKDDITGKVRTGVLIIPKLKLMSGLSMRLGDDAVPMVAVLNAVALPVGSRGNETVMELLFLNDDIDSDI